MTVLGVVLAGGLARRMGGSDKALIRLGGQTLVERSLARLRPQVDGICVNSNAAPERLAACVDVEIVPDLDDSRSGPLAGVLAGMLHAHTQGASHIVTAAVDSPFFPEDLVSRLRAGATAAEVPLACAKTGGQAHPVFGLWPVDLADDLREALEGGLRKVDRWTGRHGCAEVEFAVGAFDPFFNVNTPEDLTRAEDIDGAVRQ